MKSTTTTLLVLLCAVSLTNCNVIYRKYERTVPPRVKSHRRVTEVVEIFGTYNRPPLYTSSEDSLNLFLRNDAPPYPQYPHYPRPQQPQRPVTVAPPAQRPNPTPPPSLFGRRSTTIRPNPFENDNGYMNHYPQSGVTTTKFVPVPNFTIREPLTTTPEPETTTTVEEEEVTEEVTPEYEEEVTEEVTSQYEEEVTEEATPEYGYQEEITEEPTTESEDYYNATEEPETEEPETESPPEEKEEITATTEEVTEAPAVEEEEEDEPTTTYQPEEYDYDVGGTSSDYEEDENRETLTELPEAESLVQAEEEVTTKKSWFGW